MEVETTLGVVSDFRVAIIVGEFHIPKSPFTKVD